jgi:hypothetical protein
MSLTTDVALMAADLGNGGKTRVLCPACQGGTHNEQSMIVSKDDLGNVSYYCFRDSCRVSGYAGRSPVEAERRVRPRTNPYTGRIDALSFEDEERLRCTYNMNTAEMYQLGARWAPEVRRFMFPVWSPVLAASWPMLGYVGRSLEGAIPKAVNYVSIADVPFLSFYKRGSKQRRIVVEDIPSAVRAATYMPSVALNGTGITQDALHLLARTSPNIVIALDADATNRAWMHAREHQLLFESIEVRPLQQDLKGMKRDQLEELLAPYSA